MAAVVGPVSTVLDELDTIIQGSSTFIDQCAIDGLTVSDQIQRLAWRPDTEGSVAVPTDVFTVPMILLRQEQLQWDFQWSRNTNCAARNGVIRMVIVDKPRDATWQEAVELFDNFYGALMQDIAESDTRLPLRVIQQVEAPTPTQRKDESPYFGFFVCQFDIIEGNELT